MMTSTQTLTQTDTAVRTLNGLEPEAIAQAVGELVKNPQLAQTTFRARTSWQGRLRSRTEIDGYDLAGQNVARKHTIYSDEPLELMGTNQAPNPQDLLLAALNACMMVGFVAGATNAGLRIDSLEIASECSLDLRGAFGVEGVKPGADKIRYTVRVSGSGTPEQFEAVHREMMVVSPNRFHLVNPIALEASLVVL